MHSDKKKRFFTKHAKSSAMVASLAVHAVLIVVALSFVAVTVIQKDDQNFKARQVVRPKMAMKKLQVPVKIKSKRPKPKLRKQITVKARMDRKMPDIKMPELVGIKGGQGSVDSGGLGGSGGVGFSMPEVEVFGIKSKGEKIYLVLDSSPHMMYDEMGGIPAYTIIKEELIRIVGSLGSATLFNVVVFDGGRTYLLFPSMVPASSANAARVEDWLAPLNAVRPGMGSMDYGVDTLGPGGTRRDDDLRIGPFRAKNYRWQESFYLPVMIAMQQQADAIFILTNDWGHQRAELKGRDKGWDQTSSGRKWMECFEKGKKMLEEENRKRAENGQPPRVVAVHPWAINHVYFPDIERPPEAEFYHYTPRDFLQAFREMRARYRPASSQTKSGIAKKKGSKLGFSLNVVQFVKENEAASGRSEDNFRKLTSLCRGNYQTLAGLEAIKSYAGR